MSIRQKSSQEDATYRVLQLLAGQPDITQREMALKMRVSVGKVNYCLRALVGRGLIKIHNFANSQNKLGYTYVLTPAGLSQKSMLASRFLKRKMDEYELLVSEIVCAGGELPILRNDVDQPVITPR